MEKKTKLLKHTKGKSHIYYIEHKVPLALSSVIEARLIDLEVKVLSGSLTKKGGDGVGAQHLY